jgi:hypothetical protein
MAGKVSGRIKRAISSCVILLGVAVVLAVSNTYIQNRDRGLATGPHGNSQLQFFVNAVDRPDISSFFKRLRPADKLKFAQNLHAYKDPRIVKLAAILLTDFDVEARTELQKVLTDLASDYPKELSDELKNTGGFQKLGVFNALRKSSDKTLPFVIDQLRNGPTRANAVEYLVGQGSKVGPAVLPMLDDKDKDTRLAAADVLGKSTYKPAAAKMRELYDAAEGGDKSAYLAALSNLGEQPLEPLFIDLLRNPKTSTSDRANAILGLARIGNPSSVRTLWVEAGKAPLDKKQILEALSLAGDLSLRDRPADLPEMLEVAGGIRSPLADSIIAEALRNPRTVDRAAQLSEQRQGLVPALQTRLSKLDPNTQGGSIEAVVQALATTKQGLSVLAEPEIKSRFSGFIDRELAKTP